MKELRVVSYNILDLPLWFVKNRESRIIQIADYLKSLNADIICVQESFDSLNRETIHNRLGADIYSATGGFNERRKVPLTYLDTTGGLLTFSKFPIKEWKFVPFKYFGYSPIEYFVRKGMLEVVVETPRGPVQVINTHLHQEGRFVRSIARLKQLGLILEQIERRQGMPTILTGDFNQPALMHRHKFADLLSASHFVHPVLTKEQEFFPSYRISNPLVNLWLNPIGGSRRLDYILVRLIEKLGMRVSEYSPVYLNPALSDHDPVMLSLFASD
jgi:endonuclease/exonuclease/phosphatase family metal-dependent hydrolase